MIHGFFGMANMFDKAKEAVAEVSQALRAAFDEQSASPIA